MIKKNEKYIVDIIDNGTDGEGIAKIEDFTVFIPGAIKGEQIEILIIKVLTTYGYGKIIKIISKSPYREEPECTTYVRCGGCNMQHMNYEKTLQVKKEKVQNLVNKELNTKVEVKDVLGMGNPYFYRNKAQFPVGIDKNGEPQIGIFANRSHEIIPINQCLIQNKDIQEIAKFIFYIIKREKISIYNEKTGKGLIRHIVVKIGINTNEVMCILVINGEKLQYQEKIANEIINKYENVKSIIINKNKKNTNVILGKENICIYGKENISDILGEYTFKISPLSFYQVNPVQAEALYNIGLENANIQSNDIVFDLYCGIGTISIFAAKYAKEVYGIEIVEEAIENAKENAKINNVKNIHFFAGDVQDVLDKLINEQKIVPNVVIFDPPRKGLDKKSIENILKVLPSKIVYISCNPATLIRDISAIEDVYDVKFIKPVDLFPWTSHVECVAVLQLKQEL